VVAGAGWRLSGISLTRNCALAIEINKQATAPTMSKAKIFPDILGIVDLIWFFLMNFDELMTCF
jgi:hypothetical protein